jgi:stage II sporulation protein R
VAVVVAASIVAGALAASYAQDHRARMAYSTSNLVRLHIVANSDGADDQKVKLAVRDAIADELSEGLRRLSSAEEAEQFIRDNLPLIERRAAEVVRQSGKKYGAKAVLGRFPFPPRVYGQVALPAGEYRALKLVLGEGRGGNWWCVMFPPLCFVDITGAGSRPEGEGGKTVRFFLAEWLRDRAAQARRVFAGVRTTPGTG